MARSHVARLDASDPDLVAVFYVDGHVRADQGARKVAKTHLSRLKFPAPATVETWISDASGDPVLVVMAEPGASLAMELRRLLPDLRRPSATSCGSWSGSTAAAGPRPCSLNWTIAIVATQWIRATGSQRFRSGAGPQATSCRGLRRARC